MMLCEDLPGRHAIEMSTLKYVDSNPVDETLLAHRLPPPPQIPGRSPNRTHNKGSTTAPNKSPENKGFISAFTQESSTEVKTKGLSLNEHSQRQQGQPIQQEQQHQEQQQQRSQTQRPRQHSILPSNFLNPSGDGTSILGPPIRRLSCVSAVITHPQQHQQLQQPRHGPGSGGSGGGGGPGTAGTGTSYSGGAGQQPLPPTPPRRLPDFVTIDQCYSAAAADDQDCSTVCLIANFDVGGRGLGGGGGGGFLASSTNTAKNNANININNNNNNNAITNNFFPNTHLTSRRGTVPANINQLHHQQQLQQLQQQQSQQQQQQHGDGGGAAGTASAARKERSSLRRGLMMRQMSLNPSHEKDIHLVAESKPEGSQLIEDSSVPPLYDTNVNNVNTPRRLSNCSFGRNPYHYQPQHPHYPRSTPANTAVQASRGGTMPCDPGDAEKEPLMGVASPSSATASHDVSVREFIGATTELQADGHNDLSQAYELKHQLPPGSHQLQLTHNPSPGTKMKMKNLKLADAASSRFRLTFDESADGPANKYIDVPIDVSPHTPSMGPKRPSCICGEPELPPGDVFSLSPDPNKDHLDGRQTQSCHSNLKTLNDPPPESTSANQIQLFVSPPSNNSSLSNIFHGCQQPTEYSSTPVPPSATNEVPGSMSPATDLSLDMISSGNSSENKNTTSETEQSSQELNGVTPHAPPVEHPKVTICISNSQQSFIPLNYDSNSPHDSGSEDHQIQQPPPHQQQHQCAYQNSQNYHQYGPGNSYYFPHPGMPNAGDNYSYYPDDNVNGSIPGMETEDIAHYGGYGGPYSQRPSLQHQDTVSAPPIQDLYRYHVFFSHCSEDREWVEHMVSHLEAPPFNYTCAYASVEDEADPSTLQQRILCAAMLSERVVLVLSNRYVEETWFNFEKTLKQLTQMSLHNQRIMGVLLEDCEIPDTLGELYFLDSSDPDFFHVFTKRLKTSRIPRSSASVSSDLGQNALAPANVTNGKILTFCRLQIKVGWNSHLVPADDPSLDIPPSLSAHGIGMERTEFGEIVSKVSGIVNGSNKLPWLLSAQPMAALLLAGGLWLPAFIAVLVVHVDDDSGIALPVRLAVFLFPLGLVAAAYLIKWRRSYWLTKIVRLLVQNCIDVNQALYFQGRPLFVTAAHVRANFFAIYFVYFDATDCVRSVDLLLFTCMEEDWEKLLKLVTFYTRDENYLSRMSISERLTVMMSAPYLVKLVRQVLPHPPQQRHVSKLLCLCQFTEECISRFAHGLDREDVPGLAELFTRHMPGKVSGSAVRRVQEELFHANHGLVP